MTPAAQRFIGKASFEGIVGAPVLTDEFERDPARGAFPGDPSGEHDPIGHLAVVANADAYLVAPASANTVAKLAAGIADSMVTTSFLACAAPRLVAPAMNDRMYRDAATQANLATLRQRGITVIDPEEGALASRGEQGLGRLPEPGALLGAIEQAVPGPSGPLDGLRVLISAGGTREPIDPVRFIGNRSSGRMGLALAGRAARRGAEVKLVAANVALAAPPGVTRIDVETASELADALGDEFDSADVLVMAAAPADFRPKQAAGEKIHREGTRGFELELEATDDILAILAARRREGQTIVGFAAETNAGLDRAREKLKRKGADAIVLNDVSRREIGFESTENEVVIVERGGKHHVPIDSKEAIADAILDRIEAIRSGSDARRAEAGE
jgi:phosphopantothenoylcysteine decarboxylase / phosphopantothenate---cysteine ligase